MAGGGALYIDGDAIREDSESFSVNDDTELGSLRAAEFAGCFLGVLFVVSCSIRVASFPGLRTAFVACSTKSVASIRVNCIEITMNVIIERTSEAHTLIHCVAKSMGNIHHANLRPNGNCLFLYSYTILLTQ